MFRRSLSALLVAAFAAVSLLGHGGLHLLLGGDDCHGHGPAALAAGGHAHNDRGHAHSGHDHGHCCSHDHSNSHSDAPAEKPSQPAPHEHDHDHCLLCQWHAQGQLGAVDVAVPLSEACCLDVVRPAAQVVTSFRLSRLLTRGPPLQG